MTTLGVSHIGPHSHKHVDRSEQLSQKFGLDPLNVPFRHRTVASQRPSSWRARGVGLAEEHGSRVVTVELGKPLAACVEVVGGSGDIVSADRMRAVRELFHARFRGCSLVTLSLSHGSGTQEQPN